MTHIIWFNGQEQDIEAPTVSLNDRGWEFGIGVFDTLIAIDGKPIRAGHHIDRLFRHARLLLGVEPWLSKEEIILIIENLLEKNGQMKGIYAVKTQITEGIGKARSLAADVDKATIAIRSFAHPVSTNFEPAKLVIAKARRNEGSLHSRVKSMAYFENVLAAKEATEAGVDDAIMLNNRDQVTCCTTSNIFVFKDGVFYTAPQTDGTNDGTIREKMLTDQDYYPVEEKSLVVDDLFSADGVFMTNTVMGLRPVIEIDGKALSVASVDIPTNFHLS